MFEFKLPDVGEGVHEGEIVRWLVKEGDRVQEDQPIVEVMTDKATVEITSPRAGVIAKIAAEEGATLKVGEVLVAIDEGGAGGGKPPVKTEAEPGARAEPAEAAGAEAGERAPPEKKDKTLFEGLGEGALGAYESPEARARAAQAVQAGAHAPDAQQRPGGKVLATPATRRLAREKGVDLASVRGTGPQGRVTKEDVLQAGEAAEAPMPGARPREAAAPAPARAPERPAGEVERVPIRALRKRIYENMRRSMDHAAHFTYVDECDVTKLVNLREEAKALAEGQGVKLTYLPFIVKAAAAALKRYPDINARIDDEKMELVRHRAVNMGIAVQTERGLMVFVVKDLDRKGILEIAREMEELSDRARAGKIGPEDLQGGTFTITSLGKTGGLLATPIINYPEVAIMGVHKIEKRPAVAEDGKSVVVRDRMNLSFSFDHRVIDGAIGAEFAQLIIRFLEEPSLLLLETV